MPVLWMGALAVCGGFVWAGLSGSIWAFGLAHALMGFVGSSATFAPLMADTALWWNRRRGIAVAICASGNYIAGAIWPPLVQRSVETLGWRHTYLLVGLVCGLGMFVLSLRMRQRTPLVTLATTSASAPVLDRSRPLGLKPARAQSLLFMAGMACCVAMSMPQVHIVATLLGMALGGWMSGWVFNMTGSYHATFLNGIAWNLLNLCIAASLFWRLRLIERRIQPQTDQQTAR